MSETERLAWARLVLAERALRQQEAQDEGGMAAHAAREEVDCAEHDLGRVVLDLGRYLPAYPPPLRMPEPTPEQRAIGERIAAQIGAAADKAARADWKAAEEHYMREMRIVRIADLLGVELRTLEALRRQCDAYTERTGEPPRAVIATEADVKALCDDMAVLRVDVLSQDARPMPINCHRYVGTIAGVPVYVPEAQPKA